MIIEKAKLDQAIYLNQIYFRTHDERYLDAMLKAEYAICGHVNGSISDMLNAVTLSSPGCDTPYKTYYECLQILGFEIIDREEVST